MLGLAWVQVLVIEVEIGLAVALVCRFRPLLSRLLAMLLFSIFFGFALSRASAGASSCACFGRFEVPPAVAAILDLLMLGLLWHWQPRSAVRAAPARRTWLIPVLAVLAGLAPLSMATSAYFAGPPALIAAPVDLGRVPRRHRVEFLLQVSNSQNHDISVTELTSSCPCLEAPKLPWHFGGGEVKQLTMILDMHKEPSFTGKLVIRFLGLKPGGCEALRGEVRVRVVSQS